MKNEAIRKTLKLLQESIQCYETLIETYGKRVKEIQDECPHDEGFDENVTIYWAPGHGFEVDVCKICGFHKNKMSEITTTITKSGPAMNHDYDLSAGNHD